MKTIAQLEKLMSKSLGREMFDRRSTLGMSREFVAERLGVSKQIIHKFENGLHVTLQTVMFLQLCKLYGLTDTQAKLHILHAYKKALEI